MIQSLKITLIILIFIFSSGIIFIIIDSLPTYINDEKNNLSGDEAGLTAMVINFILPILVVINFILLGIYFYIRKRGVLSKNNFDSK